MCPSCHRLELVLLRVPLSYVKPQHFERSRNRHGSHSRGFQAAGSSAGPGARLALRDPWGRAGDRPPSASSQVHSVSSYMPPGPHIPGAGQVALEATTQASFLPLANKGACSP